MNNDTADRKNPEEQLREQAARMERQHLNDTAELLDALQERLGAGVTEVVDALVAARNLRTWQENAKSEPTHSVDDVVRRIWNPWLRTIGYEFSIDRRATDTMVRVTRCPTFEMAREIGRETWANHLVCKGDYAMVEGFNPGLGMEFVECMMEGGKCCVQRYFEKRADTGKKR